MVFVILFWVLFVILLVLYLVILLIIKFVENLVGYGDCYGAAGSGAFGYDGDGDLGVSHGGISYKPGMGSDISVRAVVFCRTCLAGCAVVLSA